MKEKNKTKFSEPVRKQIREQAGGLCTKPDCLRLTSDGQNTNIADACHIHSAAENWKRGWGGLSHEELRSASNGIWLCKTDHGIIDGPNGKYEAWELRLWKAVRERAVMLAVHDDDIAKCQPTIGAKAVDAAIWKQINEHRGDVPFDLTTQLDPEAVKRECITEFALRISTSKPIYSGLVAPQHIPQSKTALMVRQSPLAYKIPAQPSAVTNPAYIHQPLSCSMETGDVHDEVETTVSEVADLVTGWVASVERQAPAGSVLIKAHLNVVFGLTGDETLDPDSDFATMVRGTAIFPAAVDRTTDGSILNFRTHSQEVDWRFDVMRLDGCWTANSRLLKCWDKPPSEWSPQLHLRAQAWESLLLGTEDGADLYAFLAAAIGNGVFHFHPFGLRIDESHLPPGWKQNALWIVRRILMVSEVVSRSDILHGSHWKYTDGLFDAALTDPTLHDAIDRLARAIEAGQWTSQGSFAACEVPLEFVGGRQCFLRYWRGEVSVQDLSATFKRTNWLAAS